MKMIFDYTHLKRSLLEVFGSYDVCAKCTGINLKKLVRMLNGFCDWSHEDMEAILKWFPKEKSGLLCERFFFTEAH